MIETMKQAQNNLKDGFNYFYGYNSNGTKVEVVIRFDGVQFYRFYRFNGYGMGWSKWVKASGTCEIIEKGLGERPIMPWGDNVLVGCEMPQKSFRIPKN